ncbi:hypothetical protein A11A3_16070 [Alcanivorax hongdengensis A-11-3]|uniref:DUF2914 domain-containing protein n=1 Tax=Alcanivorax hongdengensis A-11-3 TaxID=1177179 RepID=L0W7T3_9GAMM|nr:hypothetical protein A11A3_16070 [Alcanivorax hongdengensis A-11-3]
MDDITALPADAAQLMFYTEVMGGSGEALHHRWYQNNEAISDVTLSVGSDQWRTWSSKTLQDRPQQPGDQWRVDVTTDSGCELGSWTLTLGAATGTTKQHEVSSTATTFDMDAAINTIHELLTVGDISAARLAIKRASKYADGTDRQEALTELDEQTRSLAELNKEIRQRQISLARAHLQTLLASVPAQSPVYGQLKNREALLNRLSPPADSDLKTVASE